MAVYKPDYTLEKLSARVAERVISALRGATLTHEDADEIISIVRLCSPPDPKKEETTNG